MGGGVRLGLEEIGLHCWKEGIYWVTNDGDEYSVHARWSILTRLIVQKQTHANAIIFDTFTDAVLLDISPRPALFIDEISIGPTVSPVYNWDSVVLLEREFHRFGKQLCITPSRSVLSDSLFETRLARLRSRCCVACSSGALIFDQASRLARI